jgi:microcystin degradation protein MlrC
MRIAIAGISTESCTFSPLLTRREDFTLHQGTAFLNRYPFLNEFDAEFVPLMWARALPGGSVESGTYRQIRDEFITLLHQNGPFDGVYLDLHGAMNAEGMDDAEGDWIGAVRQTVGGDCLISASFDLHGNISRRVVEQIDMLSAYRTAPHVDTVETRQKALSMLIHCLKQRVRPMRAWVQIPVVLPGERTSTEWEPGASVYASLSESDPLAGVLDASLLVGYVWADEPRASATAIVTGTNADVIRREAVRIARRYWDARTQFDFGVPTGSIDECITRALEAPESCVFISDSGDNPTAGGAGDVPLFLGRLIERNVPSAVVASIGDAAAVAACEAAGIGAEVRLSLGGKLDPRTSAPLPVTGRVINIVPSQNTEVVVQIGGVKAIVTHRRRPYHFIADFQRLGIEPLEHKIVVVKIGYLEPDLKRTAPRALLALSPGAVDQAIERLPFRRIQRPKYPLDKGMTWEPEPIIFPEQD